MKIASIAIVLSIFTMYGCVTPMTPGQGTSIRIINNPKDFNCQYIAVVSGAHTSGLNSAEDVQSAIHLARNKAYDLGANAIRIINSDAIESDGAVFAEALQCDFK